MKFPARPSRTVLGKSNIAGIGIRSEIQDVVTSRKLTEQPSLSLTTLATQVNTSRGKPFSTLFSLVYLSGSQLFFGTYLDRRVAGSFITITSVMSPYLLKYSLRLSETRDKRELLSSYTLQAKTIYIHFKPTKLTT